VPTSRSRSVSLAVLIAAVALLGAVAVPGGAASALPLRQREFNPNGAWSWFADPRAVYHQGLHRRTFVGWVTSSGDVQVGSYDHDTGVRVVATVKARFQVDDHANPSLLVRPDGHLLIFWSGHGGGTMYSRRSAQPEEIGSWEPERTVPTNTRESTVTPIPTRCSCRPRATGSGCFGAAGTSTRRSPPPATPPAGRRRGR
jgi:hypothetical protein